MENNFSVSQKVNHKLTTQHRNSIYINLPKINENLCPHKDMYANFHSSIIHRAKNGNNLNVHQLVNKQNVAYPCNGILLFKRNELLMHTTTWMNLKNMLRERSQK